MQSSLGDFHVDNGVIWAGYGVESSGTVSAQYGITANSGTGFDATLYNIGGKAALLLGESQDVNLYREAANVLKTDDSLQVAGTLAVTGALSSGAITSPTVTDLKPVTRTVGPVTGNGGNLPVTYVALPGMSLSYTTPARPTRARIDVQVRLTSITAAWAFAAVGLTVSPTPTSRLHANAASGVAPAASEILALLYLHNAGAIGAHFIGFDSMLLAASTAYTFTVVAASNPANSAQFQATAQSTMIGTFTPE